MKSKNPILALDLATLPRSNARKQFWEATMGIANRDQVGWNYVYFIQAVENGPIKIGATADPPGRLRSLRTSNASPLKCLLLLRGSEHEPAMHSLFAPARLQGEWFAPCDDLNQFLDQMIKLSDLEIDVDDESVPLVMMPSLRRYDRPGFSFRDVIQAVSSMPERNVWAEFTDGDWDRFIEEYPRPQLPKTFGRRDVQEVIASWLSPKIVREDVR